MTCKSLNFTIFSTYIDNQTHLATRSVIIYVECLRAEKCSQNLNFDEDYTDRNPMA